MEEKIYFEPYNDVYYKNPDNYTSVMRKLETWVNNNCEREFLINTPTTKFSTTPAKYVEFKLRFL